MIKLLFQNSHNDLKMTENFIYEDDDGRLRLALESKRVGDRVLGPGGVLPAEKVIPIPRHSPPHLFGPERQTQTGSRLAYLYLRGIIFWAEEGGSPSSGRVRYKKMWPVLRGDFPGDLAGLVVRIVTNTLNVKTDIPMIDHHLVRADNFFVLGRKAWFSNRFHLYSGSLTDGKNFKGTLGRVSGVPKDANPAADYNHIIRCWIYKDHTSTPEGYRMLTEERVMRSSGLRRGYENNRAIINEYTSSDMERWTFNRTVGEDPRIDPKNHSKRTPIPGLPVNYLPRTFRHVVVVVGANGRSPLHESPLQGTVTGLRDRLSELFPQPGEIYMEKAARGYRAYLNRFGVNTTWTSGDGVDWVRESTLNHAYSRQGGRVPSTSVVAIGRRT
ncbi:MAG: hypothetical protein A3C38_07220 [Planctomycetes bacterium RIFCSPHIGHO2_02_FULL_50_42]|nr:MAG: hypothetical protein A2060_04365 [Planctomycetes bacterium GWA2_50_13]OHB88355.1 MAG: hypothetical protein A3C38_07220 [Planctomycetes bacterium RIFCSPHIGHO2_02_FULL_50_42]OHB91834.1 MAG: hypothetical protein A3E75_05285 [Planctomycetes bacterium RIFCSPHIGHO2_12_FULL_51_37]OHB96074.1 MAG: hypothetical protein A3I59_00995 [Planctomycetes bacterium RIFCSPLOWO2_02_FULL_50_16]OHC04516.1 MAG: hypothetical protein A3G17_01275 [Planctomycetes bacterium RIFCSPLOWO2_12_FULL_50_35]HCN19691.1 hyp